MTLTTKQIVLLCGACLLAGWLLAGSANAPSPEPQPRPAVRWIARIARGLLWVALAAEKAPEEPAASVDQFVHAHRRNDAGDTLRFREGW